MALRSAVSTALLLFLSQGFCDDNILVSDLPPGAAQDLFAMLSNSNPNAPFNADVPSNANVPYNDDFVPPSQIMCQPLQDSDIELQLYTRNNMISPIILNSSNALQIDIDPSKKVVLVIHGWIAGPTAYGIPNLRDAYLQRYDVNLIVVNWKKLAWQLYDTSVCYLPKIGAIVAKFLCNLSQMSQIPVGDIHLVGHSLGGQMSGFIGQNTMNICQQKVGRITALDPAGPRFQGSSSSQRLDATDAKFVDVIHSNEGYLGYRGNCGDVDFHVNCGTVQPGCTRIGPSLEEILQLPVSLVSCHHLRALDYMAESVNSKLFLSNSCEKCPTTCLPTLSKTNRIIMGEDCPDTATNGYVLLTKRQSPYAMG